MKLTIEHLAAYLPYKLKVIPWDIKHLHLAYILKGLEIPLCLNVLPILRPLSYLTKEIEHNGEKFVPIEEIAELNEVIFKYENKKYFCFTRKNKIKGINDMSMILSHSKNTYDWAYKDTLKLFEWHFDVFGLIENNLAISYNDL